MSWLASALRLGRRCPPGWRLTRAASEPALDAELERHLEGCPRCALEVESLWQLRQSAQAFSGPAQMSELSRQAVAAQLLTAARQPVEPRRARRPVPSWVVLAGATVFVVAASVPVAWHVLHRRPIVEYADADADAGAATRSRAWIRAIGGARYARLQARPDDVVRLDEGTIVLEVAPLPRGERFRLQTRDAEVEVRGTRFQVTASGGELLAVSVTHGRVEVRSRGGGNVLLEAGDEWIRGATEATAQPTPSSSSPIPAASSPAPAVSPYLSTTASGAPEPAPAVSPPAPAVILGPPQPARPPSRPAHPSSAAADRRADPEVPSARASFDRAWSTLRQGDPRRAAALFAEVEQLASGRGIAEDALYWRAVASARAGDGGEARSLFGDFLARFPGSSRAGEAATALGWLLLDHGEADAARRAFERATRDPSPTVRASALDGLHRAPAPASR